MSTLLSKNWKPELNARGWVFTEILSGSTVSEHHLREVMIFVDEYQTICPFVLN